MNQRYCGTTIPATVRSSGWRFIPDMKFGPNFCPISRLMRLRAPGRKIPTRITGHLLALIKSCPAGPGLKSTSTVHQTRRSVSVRAIVGTWNYGTSGCRVHSLSTRLPNMQLSTECSTTSFQNLIGSGLITRI